MNELIAIESRQIGEGEIRTVNARDLHSFLEAKKDFSNWIKDRIDKYGFTENQDYVIGSPVLANQNGRGGDRRSIDYHLTIDMAKELSMVERNEKGKQARQYFLECERQVQAPKALPQNLPEALRLAADLAEQNLQLEATVAEQKPQVEAFSRFAKSEGSFNLTSSAKLLNIKPSTLTDYMSTNRWVYKRAGSKHWTAYQNRIEQGLLRHKTFNYQDAFGDIQSGEQVMVTAKGLAHLGEIFADKPQQHVTGFRGKSISPTHVN